MNMFREKETVSGMVDRILNYNADMVVGDRFSTTYFSENKRPFHNMGILW